MSIKHTVGDSALTPHKIAVFGLGYVGSVTACCLAEDRHRVVGVDVVSEKITAINRGKSSFVEPGLDELLERVVAAGRLKATADTSKAVQDADISLISVGTPSGPNGMPDFRQLYGVCTAIGQELRKKAGIHDIVIRSTVLPGTSRRCVDLIEQSSGKREGEGFRLLVNPEFLREGTALKDYHEPPFTVIGAEQERDANRLASIYADLSCPLFVVPRREAETIKYACNLFHAVKVVFANEIGRLCRTSNVDSHRVMDIFCHDNKLNLSPYYLKPGFAYGGSCLPKDLRAILSFAREHHVSLPMLDCVQESNCEQIEMGSKFVEAQGKHRIALLGFSFKPTTDDLRESPLAILAETLIGKGYELRIFDRQVVMSNLHGANKSYLKSRLPHIESLTMDKIEDVLQWADCLVLGSPIAEAGEFFTRAVPEQTIVDLVYAVPQWKTRAAYRPLNGKNSETFEDLEESWQKVSLTPVFEWSMDAAPI